MFQDGGISQYLVDYTPFAFQQQQTEKSSSSSNKQNEVGIKDLLGLIKELKGLPIDSAIITDRINDMYTNLSLYNNGQIDTSDLVNTYLSVLRDIRTAEFNKQEYEDAKKETVSNESYNEAAFDQYGNMWIQDTESGEINRVTPEEYISMSDKESYQVLTNSNLLYLRANSPDFAFRNEILSVVHNGTSIKEITEQLQKVANHIGTTTLKEEGYSERTAQNIIEGMATLEKGFQIGMTVQGLYKQGKITKDQTQQAKAALTYLWKTLPANARGLLTLKGGSTEGALNLINTLISSSLSPEIDYTQNLIKDPREDSEKDGKDGKNGDKGDVHDKDNFYTALQKQDGGTYGTFQLNTGTPNSLFVEGTTYGNIKDNDWNPIGHASLEEVLNKGLSGIVTSTNGISFGDKIITPEDFQNIMYDNGGGMVITLPSKIVNGVRVVDLSILNQYNEAKQLFNQQKTGDPQKDLELQAKILHDKGLDELLDSNGLPNINRFQQFLVISAYGVDKDDKFENNTNGTENQFLEEVDPEDSLVTLLEQTLSTDSKKSNYKIDSFNWYAPGDWGKNYDRIFKGNLYIPITNNTSAGVYAGKDTMPYYIAYQNEKNYQDYEKRRNASTVTGADVLNF